MHVCVCVARVVCIVFAGPPAGPPTAGWGEARSGWRRVGVCPDPGGGPGGSQKGPGRVGGSREGSRGSRERSGRVWVLGVLRRVREGPRPVHRGGELALFAPPRMRCLPATDRANPACYQALGARAPGFGPRAPRLKAQAPAHDSKWGRDRPPRDAGHVAGCQVDWVAVAQQLVSDSKPSGLPNIFIIFLVALSPCDVHSCPCDVHILLVKCIISSCFVQFSFRFSSRSS